VNKIFLIFLFLFLIGIIYLFGFDKALSSNIENINYNLSKKYSEIHQVISQISQRHISQKNRITKLQNDNSVYQKQIIQLTKDLKYYKNRAVFINLDTPDKNSTQIAKVIAVQNIYTSSRFWISLNEKITGISGLISNNFAAGIVKIEQDKPIIYLNHDEKANYGVRIGDSQILGIAHGHKNTKNIIIKFIPTYSKVKVGDEVETNGLDDIFYAGLKVGRVLEVMKNNQNYNEAIVKPYASHSVQKYYYVY